MPFSIFSYFPCQKLNISFSITPSLIIQDVNKIKINVDRILIKRLSLSLITVSMIFQTGKIIFNAICKKMSSAIGALKRVWRFIRKDTAEKVYNSLTKPYTSIIPFQYGMLSAISEAANYKNYKIAV